MDYGQIAKRFWLLKYYPLQCIKKDLIFQSGRTAQGFIVRGAWGILLEMCFRKAGYKSDTIWSWEQINIPPGTLVWSGTQMSWGRTSQLALLPFPNASVAHPPVQSLGCHNASCMPRKSPTAQPGMLFAVLSVQKNSGCHNLTQSARLVKEAMVQAGIVKCLKYYFLLLF